ncbi:MAG: helix-turn-helix domain-containing protein [Eubacteriales bacterium]|jgi:AraC family transcriptional regulator
MRNYDSIPLPEVLSIARCSRTAFLKNSGSDSEWSAVLVCSGKISVTIDGQTGTAESGGVIFFPPGKQYERDIIEPAEFLFLRLKWNKSDAAMQDASFYPCGVTETKNPERAKADIAKLKAMSGEAPALPAQHIFRDLVLMPFLCGDGSIDDEAIKEAVETIERDYNSPIKIAALAKASGMSHVNFSHRFSAATGMNPIEYLRMTRLSNAKELLTNTDLSIAEVSARCGFDNQFYFSKCFKEEFGLSPLKFRQLHRI